MLQISNEGAKVLHNRCVEIGEKFNIPITTKSTFKEDEGTLISNKIEDTSVKSIIKKEVSRISIVGNGIIRNIKLIKEILDFIDQKNLELLNVDISENKISITFKNIVEDEILQQLHKIIF